MSGLRTNTRDLTRSFQKFKSERKETKQQAIDRLTAHFVKMGHKWEMAVGMAETRYHEIYGR